MSELGKILVVIGFVLVAAGALLWSGIGRGWLGRLPGDIQYSKGNATFYFPLATCGGMRSTCRCVPTCRGRWC